MSLVLISYQVVDGTLGDLTTLFKKLSNCLVLTQSYWRPVAFQNSSLPWMYRHKPLVEKLLALSLDKIDTLATTPVDLINFLAEDLPFAKEVYDLSQLELVEKQILPEVPSRFYAGIPGRKWQQVKAFTQCIDGAYDQTLEWCAGKSHLGSYINHICNTEVTSLEWDENLVNQANQRAAQQDVNLHSHLVDVLSDEAKPFLDNAQQVVALHACGELHERLLKLGVTAKVQQVQLAPCCYHKRQGDIYQPLSMLGRSVDLVLNKTELHTSVMETATAGATIQQQRKQLQIMRLGFDCLQRELLQKDQYLSVPSLAMSWAKSEFSDFCQYCAELKNINIPSSVNWLHYLKQGEARFKQVSALDLVRFLFRRPLEVWLSLDRALFLEEQGYKVSLGTFCSSQVTPRNILIKAKLES